MNIFASIFKSNINALFKKDKSGQTVVYPYGIYPKGILSYGYTINPATEAKLRAFLTKYYAAFLLHFILIFVVINSSTSFPYNVLLNVLFVAIWYGMYVKLVRKVLKGSPRTFMEVSFTKAYKDSHHLQAKSYSKGRIFLLVLVLVFMSLITISLLSQGSFIGIVSMLFTFFMLLKTGYLIKDKWYGRQKSGT